MNLEKGKKEVYCHQNSLLMTINQSMTKHILGRVFNFLTSSPFRQTGNVQLNKAQTLLSAKILYGGFNEFESDLCSNEHYL